MHSIGQREDELKCSPCTLPLAVKTKHKYTSWPGRVLYVPSHPHHCAHSSPGQPLYPIFAEHTSSLVQQCQQCHCPDFEQGQGCLLHPGIAPWIESPRNLAMIYRAVVEYVEP